MNLDLKIAKQYTFAFCLIGLIMISCNAWGQTDDAITDVLCNVVGQLKGPIGKAIATIAIIVLGIGLFMGKLSWPLALATAIGIGIIFGADGIVGWLYPDAAGACASS